MMILGFLIVIGASSYAATRYGPVLMLLIVGAMVMVPLFIAFDWIYDITGLGDVILDSWHSMIGIQRGQSVEVDCPVYGNRNIGGLFAVIAKLVIGFATLFLGVGGLFALPIAFIMCLWSGFATLFNRRDFTDQLRSNLIFFSYSIGALALTGVGLRLMRELSKMAC